MKTNEKIYSATLNNDSTTNNIKWFESGKLAELDNLDRFVLDHIHVSDYPPWKTRAESIGSNDKPFTIFCGIYTHAPQHDTAVAAIIHTWGWKCDGFVAFSTVTDEKYAGIALYVVLLIFLLILYSHCIIT